MPISGTAQKAIITHGFDVNTILTESTAKAFKNVGMEFCVRYLPRGVGMGYAPITASEAQVILNAGLALSLVQHVENPGWEPTAQLGSEYGIYAAQYAGEIGIPSGVTLWLDLEEVKVGGAAQDVTDYCNSWYDEVTTRGFDAGLYVGYRPGLNNDQLYNLHFKHYWRGYNADNSPLPRGYCMIQHDQETLNGIEYDPNLTGLDKENDIFTWLAP